MSQYWTVEPAGPSACISESRNLMAASIINTVTDFLVVLLPIPAILKLQLPLGSRCQLIFIFAVSFLVCFAGITRTIYTFKYLKTWDTTWAIFAVWISSTVELNIGIVSTLKSRLRPFRTLTIKDLQFSPCS